ncbi:MAG: TonB-dependent receptor [Bacteroidales bacterium]|nr:TonB-dependent receptor [Bacteroidales bacterium]
MSKYLTIVLCLMLCAMQLRAQGLQGRTFVYGEDVHLPKPLQISDSDTRPLDVILDEALQGTQIDYRITQRHVLLFRHVDPMSSVRCAVYGYVTDTVSGETLIGANVYCPALGAGTVTNAYGFYSLPLPAGRHALVISYVGYDNQVVSVDVKVNLPLNVALSPSRQLREVVIESDRPVTGAPSTRMGATTISMPQIQQMPSLLGEADVLKAVQLQPGVHRGFGGTSQLSVRGGNLDQNLYLLDGIMLYNVHHVLGYESAFLPEAVKRVDFYRGSFPSRYGGRLSSVVDVRVKDGDMQHYHGLFTVGLLSSHVALEGPIIKGRTSFLLTARRSYFDWLLNAGTHISEGESNSKTRLYYFDINAKVNHRFSDRDRLFVSYYRGQDGMTMDYDEFDAIAWGETYVDNRYNVGQRWGNMYGALRWNHLFSSSLFSNLTLGFNRYRMKQDCTEQYRSFYMDENKEPDYDRLHSRSTEHSENQSGIDDVVAQYDFDWRPDWRHHVRFGGSFTLHNFIPEKKSVSYQEDSSHPVGYSMTMDDDDIRGHEYALYAEDDISLSDSWQMIGGLRGVLYEVDGKRYWGAEPRLSLSYMPINGWHFKSAYTLMHQFVLLLSTSPICLPTDTWATVSQHFKPMRTHQWSVGVACDRWQGWDLTAECYYKDVHHLFECIDGGNYSGSAGSVQSKVAQGSGRSYGLELGASRTVGRLTGSVAYTLSKTDRRFPVGSINNGRRYPYEYDHRHVLHLSGSYQITPHVDFNAQWSFASGGYATVAKQTTRYITPKDNNYYDLYFLRSDNASWPKQTVEDDYYGSRCNYHMKPHHQLDLNINIHHTTKHGERIWNFSLINAYMHRNYDWVWSRVNTAEEGSGTGYGRNSVKYRRLVQLTVVPILPSASFTYKF